MSHKYDLADATPLNISVKDADETVVEIIVQHDFSNPKVVSSASRPTF